MFLSAQNRRSRSTAHAILGHNANSRGVLNLIGTDALLDLGSTGSLTIGKNGAGELNLSEGATLTFQGDAILGELAGASGSADIQGMNTKWDVAGKMTFGVGRAQSLSVHDHAEVNVAKGFAVNDGVNGGRIVQRLAVE